MSKVKLPAPYAGLAALMAVAVAVVLRRQKA
jgi:hypothetical protein